MNCQTTMYALKPIVSLPDVRPSKTVYEMRNIHKKVRAEDDHTRIEIVPDITEQSPLPEFIALEARQEKILAQLAELKKQVSTLCDFLKQTNHSVSTASDCKKQNSVSVDLIINANPKTPPYSILALQKVWTDTAFRVQEFTHSSVNGEVPNISELNTNSLNANNVVNLSLIWKEVEDLELVSGLHSYSTIGETNFIRYISRLLDKHNYERTSSTTEINRTDFVLDMCQSLRYQESPKKQKEILLSILDNLETNWCGKEEPSVADIAAWSTIRQVSPNNFPPKLNKWYKACEKAFS